MEETLLPKTLPLQIVGFHHEPLRTHVLKGNLSQNKPRPALTCRESPWTCRGTAGLCENRWRCHGLQGPHCTLVPCPALEFRTERYTTEDPGEAKPKQGSSRLSEFPWDFMLWTTRIVPRNLYLREWT